MVVTPKVIVFDVNETLSNMAPLAARFVQVGVPAYLAGEWFAALLRDGFALAAAGGRAEFSLIGRELLRKVLSGAHLNRGFDDAVAHIIGGFRELRPHPDVAPGVSELRSAGFRLVTLSNGAAQIAEKLAADAGIDSDFEAFLSVDDAPTWKPTSAAYLYAAERCGVDPGDLLLVAVHPWDIHGAAVAGLRTAWVQRGETPYPSYFAAPDLTVRGIDALPGALAAS